MINILTTKDFVNTALANGDLGFDYRLDLSSNIGYPIPQERCKLILSKKMYFFKYDLCYHRFHKQNSTKMRDIIANNIYKTDFLDLYFNKLIDEHYIFIDYLTTHTLSFFSNSKSNDEICFADSRKLIIDYISKKCEDLIYLS